LNDYVELHACSAFSFLRGASAPEHLAEAAAHLEMPAMALCDRDGVYGAPRFFARAREVGIRPIVGAELTMEDQTILPVLVESRRGYQNLCHLLTRAHLRNEKGKAAVIWEELPEFAEGLVALTGDEEGPLGKAPSSKLQAQSSFVKSTTEDKEKLQIPSPKKSEENPIGALQKLLDIFGRKNLFVEVQRHHLRGEQSRAQKLIALAEQFQLPLLATNGVLYATALERPILDVFTCIRNHTHLDAAGTLLARNSERHLKSAAEMRELFRSCPEAVSNTVRLAERLQFSLENLGYEFPAFPVPPEHTMDSFLRIQAFAGARNRYHGEIPDKVRRQLETELTLIQKLKVAGYFLIVWDMIEFCRKNNIMTQGRGSAANSTVCFCLGITAVDPIRFNTLFERFLTEGRKSSWPDIDIDLPSGDRRERVLQEIYQRYGKQGAAMTANVITYRGRSAAREIGKALNISGDVLNRFSSLYANGDFPNTLELQPHMEKAGLPAAHPRAHAFAMLYRAMQGLPRHLGQHSGGMIICQDKLSSVVPLENASMPNRVVAQWDKDDCEDLGIIKVDFLGLGMMSVLQDSVELAGKRGRSVDLAHLPENDPKTFEMMQHADTIGVFQIESRAQMSTLPRMKPVCFYDVVIEVAIIRPGPIQGGLMHPYLERRAGRQLVTYPHDDLKPVLERTLGVPLFQEQMLQIAMVLADFTGTEAEELRRALSFHRSEERMQKVEKKLRAAMERKGHSAELIEQIAAAISSFALYGFPESHAISFAHLAYASAYLKAHRGPEFYAGLLNNQPMGFYSSATLIKDGQRHGVKFRPVCVERSEWNCEVEPDDAIRLGFRVVRGMSSQSAERLVAQRREARFDSVEDFKRRAWLAKDELRALAGIGALNCFGGHRRDALWEVEKEVYSGDLFERYGGMGQALSCGGAVPLHSAPLPEGGETDIEPVEPLPSTKRSISPLQPMAYAERIRADYNGMGLTTGSHPMGLVRGKLKGIWRAVDLPKAKHGSRVRIAGNVICRQRPGTAQGVVFISLEDETGVSNAIVTPSTFEEMRLVITQEPFLIIEGRLQNVEGVIHVKAERIERLQEDALVKSPSHDFR
jgi:error-prone DNA polymerase